MSEMPSVDRLIELERDEAVRKALESAAKTLEDRAGNEVYQRAWKAAARVIRSLMPG